MKNEDQRLIEDYIPILQISRESTREKIGGHQISKGMPRNLHLWWARRPLAASRAAVYAALVPALSADTDRKKLDAFFEKLCHWPTIEGIGEAREQIMKAFGGRPPKVLDPFAGGGAIPLEMVRLGCETYGVDLNPVAYLINLCTNVYPQQFGAKLKEQVEVWGTKLINNVKAEVGDLYPAIPDPAAKEHGKKAKQMDLMAGAAKGAATLTPVAYLWTRTVPCPETPNRPAHAVPLVRQTWLVRKNKRYVALKMVPDRKSMRVRFEVVTAESEEEMGFDPADFSERGEASCQLCGNTVSLDYIKEQGKRGKMGYLPMALVCFDKGVRGKQYFALNESIPEKTIEARLKALAEEHALAPPDEPIQDKDTMNIKVPLYGLSKFSDLFTPRQLLMLLSFAKHIRLAHTEMLAEGMKQDLAVAVTTYLGMLLDRLVDRSSTLCHWDNSAEKTANTYARQALPMVWDFSETNPFGSSSGSVEEALKQILLVVDHCAKTGTPAKMVRGSATKLPFDDESLDAVVTDPPYYDNISYSDLSDFFYVWLKRSVGHLYPEHFSGDATPKKSEIIAANYRHESKDAARTAYEQMMEEALRECRRVLKPGCPLVAVYAHKTSAGWATMIRALRRSRFVVTEAWPLDTEMPDRAGQMNTAHLATSIFIVARRRESEATGDYQREVRPELQRILAERVRTLFKLGVSGSDLIIASLGAGLRAYTQFAKVELPNGDELGEEAFLDEVQREALEIVLEQVLHCDRHGVSTMDKPTQFYVLGRFEYAEESVDYGEVNILAKGVGVEVDGMHGLSAGCFPLVNVTKSAVALLDYAARGNDEDLGLPQNGAAAPLIDVLHRLLWLSENSPAMVSEFLDGARPDGDKLRLVAQALAGRTITEQGGTRSAEQQALDRILASWRNVVEQTLFTRGGA